MGDRLNIIVKQGNDDPAIVVYSHWGGTALHDGGIDRAMQAAAGHAGDPHYYTAVFIQSVAEQGYLSGVGTSLDDTTGYPTSVVDAITNSRELPGLSDMEAKQLLKDLRRGE